MTEFILTFVLTFAEAPTKTIPLSLKSWIATATPRNDLLLAVTLVRSPFLSAIADHFPSRGTLGNLLHQSLNLFAKLRLAPIAHHPPHITYHRAKGS